MDLDFSKTKYLHSIKYNWRTRGTQLMYCVPCNLNFCIYRKKWNEEGVSVELWMCRQLILFKWPVCGLLGWLNEHRSKSFRWTGIKVPEDFSWHIMWSWDQSSEWEFIFFITFDRFCPEWLQQLANFETKIPFILIASIHWVNINWNNLENISCTRNLGKDSFNFWQWQWEIYFRFQGYIKCNVYRMYYG